MSTPALDRLLAILIVAQVATGLMTLRAGVPAAAPLFWAHGLLGGALLVASLEKLRRSVGPAIRRRRWGPLALGSVLSLLVGAALAGGFAWVASGRILSIGPWTILTLHVFAGLAVVPIVVFHLLPRRWRLLRHSRRDGRPMSRRTMLGLGAVAVLGAAAWGGANLLDRLRGGVRRFTGSRWLPAGGIPPPTTFYGEPAPPIEAETWRLAVTGRVARPLTLDRAGLSALGEVERDETLDCTGGWVMTTRWRGVPLLRVLEAAGAQPAVAFVRVRSVTGWMVTLEHREFETALLATGVAGVDLPAGNGAPCRLVAPRRRGLDWIKWVAEIQVG
jgi:hypothetical protein